MGRSWVLSLLSRVRLLSQASAQIGRRCFEQLLTLNPEETPGKSTEKLSVAAGIDRGNSSNSITVWMGSPRSKWHLYMGKSIELYWTIGDCPKAMITKWCRKPAAFCEQKQGFWLEYTVTYHPILDLVALCCPKLIITIIYLNIYNIYIYIYYIIYIYILFIYIIYI